MGWDGLFRSGLFSGVYSVREMKTSNLAERFTKRNNQARNNRLRVSLRNQETNEWRCYIINYNVYFHQFRLVVNRNSRCSFPAFTPHLSPGPLDLFRLLIVFS
jgi:hypothetical protein